MNFQFSLIYYFLTKTSNNKVFDEDKGQVFRVIPRVILCYICHKGEELIKYLKASKIRPVLIILYRNVD